MCPPFILTMDALQIAITAKVKAIKSISMGIPKTNQ